MTNPGIAVIILVIINIAFSYKGFKDHRFFDKYKFEVDRVLLYKDYKVLISAGFLHVNWTHLIFNMISLLAFGGVVESFLGVAEFMVIYLSGLLGGGLLALLIHKRDGGYSSVGASGAVCAVIFASIALFPGFGIGFFFIPVSIPAWIYGLGYVLYSIYGIKSKKDNVGHEAHLGGALVGMAVALLLHPAAFPENYWAILIIAVPTIAFIYVIVTRPHVLLIDNYFFKKNQDHYSVDHKYNEERTNKQKEIDRILDKIGKRGMNSLSKEEKRRLEEYSKS
jgi:membrane associated rhomboid family serine protease